MLLRFIKWTLLAVGSCLFLWFIISFTLYRLTDKSKEELVGEVHYKFIELNITNRQIFEELIGNKIVRLENYGVFYVSPNDRKLLWPENPHEMLKKKYTIKAKIEVSSLKFGGYSVAKVVSTEKLDQQPIISK